MSDFNFPVVITQAGLQPQDPSDIRAQIVAAVQVAAPGATTDLPGSMVEDIVSTDVAAVALCDQEKVEAVNSLTPLGANEFTLGQLGTIYIGEGSPGTPSTSSVFVVFTGTVGFPIPVGFLVSDGTNVYQVRTNLGVIQSGGVSAPILATAVQKDATFAIPANTVTSTRTSYPSNITLSVNNPNAGTAGGVVEDWSSFRMRVLQAGNSACVGAIDFIKTLVKSVPGVQKNSVSVQPVIGPPNGFRVIVLGGDPFAVANAIYQSVADTTQLLGAAAGGTTVTVSLISPPNTINVKSVTPIAQAVLATFTWNTTLTNFTGGGSFTSLAGPPLAAYINSVMSGAPMNTLEMSKIFQDAVSSVLDPNFLTRLVIAISINGTVVPPLTGTFEVVGDAEGYFTTDPTGAGITVVQG